MIKDHFTMLARYNQWANTRLYDMAGALADDLYRRDAGAYFGSLHGTLNHILVGDRVWMHRMTGTGDHPDKLDAILFESLYKLREAREAEDARILSFVSSLAEADFGKPWDYQTLNGTPQRQLLREILAHFFNHQTHHRGQAHAVLTMLGVEEPAGLDLLIMQRETR